MHCSVVIPSYQRRETLRLVLAAWQNQRPDGLAFEVVVVDDGSQDGTADFLATWRPQRYAFRFACQENAGPARARNRALEMARGELILFTGDDIEPAPDLLQQHVEGHRQHRDPQVAILGLTRWPEEGNAAQAITATMRHIDGPGAQQFSYYYFEDGAEYDFRHLYTSNVSVHRSLLDLEPTGFSTDFPAAAFEDAEFGHRLARHGLRILYRQKAVAWHHHPYDARTFYRRQQRCGTMAAVLYQKLPKMRRHLDLDILKKTRRKLLYHSLIGAPSPFETPLHEAEESALRVAMFFDPLPFDAVDLLLKPLFRHGYLSGLAQALYPQATAKGLMTLLFARQVLPTVARLEEKIVEGGLPAPEMDLRALRQLVTSSSTG